VTRWEKMTRKQKDDHLILARAWAKANPEKKRASVARWRKANPDKARAADARWLEANRERLRAVRASWRKANRERMLALQARWRKKHPEHSLAKNARRRARLVAADISLTTEERATILALYSKARALTELTGEAYHVDHIKPLSKGGPHHPDNLQILLGRDNLSKGAKYHE
jgi:5-methylcytosine-specific restriction endonuclease McrA